METKRVPVVPSTSVYESDYVIPYSHGTMFWGLWTVDATASTSATRSQDAPSILSEHDWAWTTDPAKGARAAWRARDCIRPGKCICTRPRVAGSLGADSLDGAHASWRQGWEGQRQREPA